MVLPSTTNSDKTIYMKSHDHLIEQLADLGVFLSIKEMGLIRQAVKLDRKVDKKLKNRKIKLEMISSYKPQGR